MNKDFVIKDNVLIAYMGIKKEIIIPDDVKIIETKAFYQNTNIEKIIINENVEKIGAESFSNCRNLKKVLFNNNKIKSIEENTFINCTFLNEVILPETCQILKEHSFINCPRLKHINLENIEIIGKQAFYGCYNLEHVKLKKIKELEFGAFEKSGLKNLEIENTVNMIDRAFNGSQLKRVKIAGLNNITQHMFNNCNKLEYIEVGTTFKDINNKKQYKTKNGMIYSADEKELIYCPPLINLEKFKIPDNVEILDDDLFADNKYIKEIELGKNVKKIGKYCFCGTNTEKIILNKNLKNIGHNSFYGIKGTVDMSKTEIKKINVDDLGLIGNEPRTIVLPSKIEEIDFSIFINKINFIMHSNKNEKLINEIQKRNKQGYTVRIQIESLDELILSGKSFLEANRRIKEQER